MYIKNNNIAKQISSACLMLISISLLGGCVTQSFENNEPIVKSQANRDEMAATRISLGLGYLKMGDMPQAKLNLEKAKNFSPNLVQVHTAFAHYYETVGESKLAIEAFEQALLIKDDSADTLNNYGVFLCRQGDVEAAEVQFLKAIEVPSYLLVSESYENLASCYLQNDDFEKSEMYLRKSIFHSPNRTSTLLQMVRLQYAMEDYKEAKRFLHKFERNTQRFTADSLSLAYKLYRKLGQRRTASNYGNMLVKMYPQSWEGKQYLLNELEFIPADDLARRYESSQKKKNNTLMTSSKKRVVKLSPNMPRKPIKTKTKTKAKIAEESIQAESKVLVASTSEPTSLTNAPVAATTASINNSGATNGVAQATVNTGSAIIASTASTASTIATTTVAGTTAAVVATAANNAPVGETTPINTDSTPAGVNVQDAEQLKNSEDGAVNSSQVEMLAEPTAEQIIPVTVASETAVINNNAAVLTPLTSAEITNELEPTSTQPIAAVRDVPLPEPLLEPIVEEVIEPAIVQAEPEVATLVATDKAASEKLAENIESETLIETTETEMVEKIDIKDAMHVVESGQNLYNISVKYNVRLKALRKWNNISESNNIRVGDKLYVVDPKTVKMN